MKNNYGWIKLHRTLEDKGYYKNSKYVHLWIHILLKANHEKNEFMWNNKIMIIKEGQFITGRKQLSLETGLTETTIENILNMFEKEQQIGQQKTTKFRLITVINWKEYQANGQQSDNRVTTNGQQSDTNKNDKNDKNEKKKREFFLKNKKGVSSDSTPLEKYKRASYDERKHLPKPTFWDLPMRWKSANRRWYVIEDVTRKEYIEDEDKIEWK